jgi:hypothetical protein
MSHVSASQLRSFVATGQALSGFEAHVDGCARCARRLQQAAERHFAPVRAWPALRLELVVALAVLALAVVWPRSLAEPRLTPMPPSGDLVAGVPDSGTPSPEADPARAVLFASIDGGGVR